jgi:predicted transposase YdaD
VTTKPYDPTLKALVETEPEAWPVFLGRPKARTEVIDADIATVSGAADKVLRVSAKLPYLLHLEFVAGHDAATLPRKLHVRNGLLDDRHDLQVRTAVVLLRPEADSPQLTGVYQRGFPGEEAYLTFRYQVVRVWQLELEPLLTGGLALLPLAPISAVTEAQLPGIIQRMEQRLSGRRERKQASAVWTAAYLLAGLRYSPELAEQLFRGMVSMKESSTYQAILAEGEARGAAKAEARGAVAEARKVLRLQGDKLFGPPDGATAAVIEQLSDLARLEELLGRVPTAGNWQELLGEPAPKPRSRRRRSP